MPDVYLRLIEPLIAIVLDDGHAVANPLSPQHALSLPSSGHYLPDLGRLSPRQAALLLVYTHRHYRTSNVCDPNRVGLAVVECLLWSA
jgi:hypothetical protein